MFVMIVALGLFHALVALPVLLSILGSAPYDSAFDKAQATEMAKTGGVSDMNSITPPETEVMI